MGIFGMSIHIYHCVIHLTVRIRICSGIDVRGIRNLSKNLVPFFLFILAEGCERKVDRVPFVRISVPLLRKS